MKKLLPKILIILTIATMLSTSMVFPFIASAASASDVTPILGGESFCVVAPFSSDNWSTNFVVQTDPDVNGNYMRLAVWYESGNYHFYTERYNSSGSVTYANDSFFSASNLDIVVFSFAFPLNANGFYVEFSVESLTYVLDPDTGYRSYQSKSLILNGSGDTKLIRYPYIQSWNLTRIYPDNGRISVQSLSAWQLLKGYILGNNSDEGYDDGYMAALSARSLFSRFYLANINTGLIDPNETRSLVIRSENFSRSQLELARNGRDYLDFAVSLGYYFEFGRGELNDLETVQLRVVMLDGSVEIFPFEEFSMSLYMRTVRLTGLTDSSFNNVDYAYIWIGTQPGSDSFYLENGNSNFALAYVVAGSDVDIRMQEDILIERTEYFEREIYNFISGDVVFEPVGNGWGKILGIKLFGDVSLGLILIVPLALSIFGLFITMILHR